jgi:hypothetical protein
MKDLNHILIQFSRAITCANSKYPQDKAIAVILLDNLIELQLYKRAESAFMRDRATWYGGSRTISKRERQNIIGEKGKYERLLKFSKDSSLFSDEEQEIIKFAHEIRNAVYHRAEDDEIKIDIALLLYFSFLKRKLKIWGSPNRLIMFTSRAAYEQIDFGQGIEKGEHIRGLYHQKYFDTTLDYLFSTWQFTDQLDTKAIKLFSEQLRSIRSGLLFIKECSKDINYYAALSYYWSLNDLFTKYEEIKRKPRDVDSILLISMYIREHKDELEDIDDLKSRQTRGRALLSQHRQKFKGRYPFWFDLDMIEKRIVNLKGKTEHTIIKNLIDIQSKLHNLFQDVGEATSNFDGYIQDMSDRIRGK